MMKLKAIPGQKQQRNAYEAKYKSENENVQKRGLRPCEQRYLEARAANSPSHAQSVPLTSTNTNPATPPMRLIVPRVCGKALEGQAAHESRHETALSSGQAANQRRHIGRYIHEARTLASPHCASLSLPSSHGTRPFAD